MILGHIGVRAGSKGVQGKNFKMIAGKPLLAWTFDQMASIADVDAIVLSTDSPEMYAFGQARGAIDIGLRPAELATDSAGKWDVWVHALDAVEKATGKTVSTFLDLDCTAPIRAKEDVEGALALFAEETPDMVMACCNARKNPYFNMVEPDETGAISVSKALEIPILARQKAPPVYEHAGGTYVVSPDYLRSAASLFEGRVIPYLMPWERCIDIDDPFDFKLAEWALEQGFNIPKPA